MVSLPPSVNFKGPQAILQAIGSRARLILIPVGMKLIETKIT